ncbi:MAG: translation initiation factor IF-3 [Halorhodospira halophila]|uniref:translation initiation factor IF-3 n=1 Tax=Halorhodospira sp. 9621 TaxID=2899135 RepID=UPI001EE97399|nr:translation initiation factor IF-3 [Halorhodospira halophila]MBK5942685.1 translation initiation factor IF-3 [Halorhodospira halophila]MCC3751718.1 translation initiation factor IF-3 [Halorhodospira halophila]MCG5534069.1 translation initiation factor IF-3 [Halorhodospira sp. 9621]MCG5539403.1 translation initiation factor IF-3 [Halorhodospira sp. 9622]
MATRPKRGRGGGGDNRRINEQITVPQVRLIGSDGEQVGVLPTEDALAQAENEGLDLVEIDGNADPPVCRAMDYGKFKFEQSKKQQAARKKQKQIQVKEVKFRPGTDEGDFQVKLRNLRRFLEEGDKAKVTIRFRGREMAHQELGKRLLDRLEEELSDVGTVDQRPRMEGRLMVMMMSPRKGK